VLRVAWQTVLAALDRHCPVAAWIRNDTGILKSAIPLAWLGSTAACSANRTNCKWQ